MLLQRTMAGPMKAKRALGMAMKAINKDKQPTNVNLLKTRVSQSGRIYVRLPDGTLPITKTASDRAAELSRQSPQEAVAAAQERAKSLKQSQ